MKPFLPLFLAGCCLAGCATSRDVVVRQLDRDLPANENERSGFLWYCFANKHDESKFSSQKTKDWQVKYEKFSTALVKKAESLGFDPVSLAEILRLIHGDADLYGQAYLPVGAYQTNLSGDRVWIVVIKWERSDCAELGHVRMYAYNQRNLKQVAFKTCM